jgi:hypothetical protein
MQPQIELYFTWRRKAVKESIVAVTKAVAAGYNTKDKLTSALPQFSIYRLALAIDVLISAGMAENNLGVLNINTDMDIVFELADTKFLLPLAVDDANALVCRAIINKLGCKNPAGVESLLHTKVLGA